MKVPEFLLSLSGGPDKPSAEYVEEVFNLLDVSRIKKRQVLLNIGDVADRIYVIKRGIIKASIIDDKGALHSIRFISDGDVVSSMYSFVSQTPSTLHLECVEAGEVRAFKHQDFEYLTQLYPGLLTTFYRIMMKRYHDSMDEKSRMISRDATERYVKFMERYPSIAQRLPLKEVASFLGIRQQSLSRLRSKLDEEARR
ncbi:MAG: Crp/Fnr family transcriptional regulator [Nonlabens sp.]|nr:Crp/Fnr family transcriptional regulator [Nonlabens sp.]